MTPVVFALSLLVGSPDVQRLVDYFSDFRSDTGLTQDRASDTQVYSTAASGFSMAVHARRAEAGQIARDQAVRMVGQTIDTLVKKNPAKNRGWLYHFTDKDGNPAKCQEVSTIDTAIFYASARQAGRLLKDDALNKKIDALIDQVDVRWMVQNSPSKARICHGLHWLNGTDTSVFIPHEWDDYNEGVIAYKLFGLPFTPRRVDYNLPLFVYYYPLVFDPNNQEIKNHLRKALDYQRENLGHQGTTSGDTAHGYAFFPADYFSPLALFACQSVFPDVKIPDGLPPTLHMVNPKTRWTSHDRVGIDEGVAALLHGCR